MVIIWTDDDPFNWGPYASPGLNVLKVLFLFFPFFHLKFGFGAA